MKFLLDVNASRSVDAWLADLGHDVARVSDVDPRMPDDEILGWAVGQRRIILTTDLDFEEMIGVKDARIAACCLENLPRNEPNVFWKPPFRNTQPTWNPGRSSLPCAARPASAAPDQPPSPRGVAERRDPSTFSAGDCLAV